MMVGVFRVERIENTFGRNYKHDQAAGPQFILKMRNFVERAGCVFQGVARNDHIGPAIGNIIDKMNGMYAIFSSYLTGLLIDFDADLFRAIEVL